MRAAAIAACAALSLVGSAALAQLPPFVLEPGWLPTGAGIDSLSSDLDFGDGDLDGDWDIAYACGSTLGFPSPDNCRIFVNSGGTQGGVLGIFADETSTRFPAHFVNANDVEWVDIDGDGDPDLHITTDARVFNHGAKWFVNQGGAQGGQLGYFVDETSARWLGLGQSGSSIPPSYVVAGGGFVDYGGDGTFGDLDLDGDLDLFHASAGSPGDSSAANTPSRIFLNDGLGRFQEFNPTGVVASGGKLVAGQAALWASGAYAPDTLISDGSSADVAMWCFDSELVDIDGDFDLDVIAADLKRSLRTFANQHAENAGTSLGFIDRTGVALPFGVVFDTGQTSQLPADIDLDGDVDLFLTRGQAQPGFDDGILQNDGAGKFTIQEYMSPPTADWEVDGVDFDNDGRIDFVFSEMDPGSGGRIRRNVGPGSYPIEALHPDTARSGDADACDVDLDGDYDLVFTDWNGGPLRLLRNQTDVADQISPVIAATSTLAARDAMNGEVSIGCNVRENAPIDLDGAAHLSVECSVDGWKLPGIQAAMSGAQTWTTKLPANLLGTVQFSSLATDGHSNTGTTSAKSALFSTSLAFWSSYGAAGALAGFGGTPVLQPLSVPFVDSTLYLGASCNAPTGTSVLFAISTQMTAPLSIPGLLTTNVLPPLAVLRWKTLDAAGKATLDAYVPPGASGIQVYAQCFVLSPSSTGELFTGSSGLQLAIQ